MADLRQHFSRAGWWVLASAAGLALGLGLGRVLGEGLYNVVLGSLGETVAKILATVTFTTLLLGGFGVITGSALLWLLRPANLEQV